MRRLMIAIVALLPGLAAAQPASPPPAGASASRPVRATATPTSTPTAGAPARVPSSAQLAQRQRMRDCSTEARGRNLTGPPRAAFMRPCLGGNPPVAGAAN